MDNEEESMGIVSANKEYYEIVYNSTPARERGKGRGRRIDIGRGESSRSERCDNSRCGRGTLTSSSYSAVDGGHQRVSARPVSNVTGFSLHWSVMVGTDQLQTRNDHYSPPPRMILSQDLDLDQKPFIII